METLSQIVLSTAGIWMFFLFHWLLPSMPKQELALVIFTSWAFISPFIFFSMLRTATSSNRSSNAIIEEA